MNLINAIRHGNRSILMQLFPSVLILMVLEITSCKEKPIPYSILEFSGDCSIMNYSKSPLLMSYESDSSNPTAILAGSGDLITLNEEQMFYYRESAKNKFLFRTSDGSTYLNDKIISIDISDKVDMIPWFKKMNSTDISSLDFLNINSDIPENYFPYLSDLAKIRPDIGFVYNGDLKDIAMLFEIFNPRLVVGAELSQQEYNLLPGLTNLELLMVSLSDTVNMIPLPFMPHLKQLFLTCGDKKIFMADNYLTNNKQVERFMMSGSGSFNFSLIRPLINLKELIIKGFDSAKNFDLIKNHKHLELLSITNEKFKYDRTLNKLHDIRWMTFSSNVTQDEFTSFIENHPDLEVVEIIRNDTITSLQPLLKLSGLFGLSLTDTITDFTTIKSLKHLKYLSLPDAVYDDSIKNGELRNLLPDTRIVANDGFCLGSGWLLLLIPFVLLFRVLSGHKSRRIDNRI